SDGRKCLLLFLVGLIADQSRESGGARNAGSNAPSPVVAQSETPRLGHCAARERCQEFRGRGCMFVSATNYQKGACEDHFSAMRTANTLPSTMPGSEPASKDLMMAQ
ncbi:MAG TPA: hypothetical protein VGG64_13130, partial [Pirellulales bacterium]